jgi:PilZ domain-containing protein
MRALRYNLQLTVRFRSAGETAWRDGTTQNVSSTGVLFHATTPMAANTPVELRLALPLGASPHAFSEVICNGRIVRTVAPSQADTRTGIAVEISDYKLVRGSREPNES